MGANHVVMMGGPIAIYGQMQKLVIQSGDPDLMASRLHELASASGAVLIAAHPNCSAYKFDKALLKWVDAVEIFDGTADPLSELRVVASHPEAKSRTLAVVTGSDFHADNVTRLDTLGKMVRLKPVEMARAANPLARHIWAPVSSPKATREELIEAIKQRRTYASIAPARIVTAKTMPGGRHDTREVLGMRLDGMNWALGRSVHCLLVRRGSGDVRELEMPINVTGTVTGDFQLDFAKLPPAVLRDGSFLYLMVANQIATSGIELAPRPDVVVAKKRNLLQQAGDLLGQVAEVLAPTTTRSPSTAPRPPLNPSSPPTPPAFVPIPAPATALPIIATYAGELSGTSGYLPCRIRFDVLKDLCAVVTVVIRGADRPVIWQKQMACEKAHAFGSGKPMVRWALVYPTDNGLILDAPGEPQFQSEAGLSHVTGFVLIILQRPWANEIEFPDEIGERTGPTGFGYGAAGGRERFRTFALRRVK